MVGTEAATVELGIEDVVLVVLKGAEVPGGDGVEITVEEVVDVAEVVVVLLVVGWLEDEVVDDFVVDG